MPDIFDFEKGLKIGLTDSDFADFQNGLLSGDFFARRTDGSIANRVEISPLDDDDNDDGDEGLLSGIDARSVAVGVLIGAAVVGAGFGIKKLWDRYQAKKSEAEITEMHKTQTGLLDEKNTEISVESPCVQQVAENVDDSEQKLLSQEEILQEVMKIFVGMTEIADGKNKVSEGVEKLDSAGIVDGVALLEKLSNPEVLEGFNEYLKSNPRLVAQNQQTLDGIFGRSMVSDGEYVPLTVPEIERRLRDESQNDK